LYLACAIWPPSVFPLGNWITAVLQLLSSAGTHSVTRSVTWLALYWPILSVPSPDSTFLVCLGKLVCCAPSMQPPQRIHIASVMKQCSSYVTCCSSYGSTLHPPFNIAI
jgi:hypothetical protein